VIVRRWSARLESGNVQAYIAHLDHAVKPALAALPGFIEAIVLERSVEESTPPRSEVVVETRWESLDAIRAFAGEDISAAVVEPAAARLFAEYDHRVIHYDVIG
jgi:heme-degrading monooxygenase HmoA